MTEPESVDGPDRPVTIEAMPDEPRNLGAVMLRRASPDDYAAFTRLFPELHVDDPVPALAIWSSALVPTTWLATRGEEVLGYCYFQEYADTGYVRNVVVAPGARRQGVGRALMDVTADELRAHGKTSWRLNVKHDNVAALALYARMGLRPQYRATALCVPWAAADFIPTGNAVVRDLPPGRDTALERLFTLPRGQLAFARRLGRILFEAVSGTARRSTGLAVLDPGFPGAFPFRVRELAAITPLLAAMRPHIRNHDYINLVAEDDDRLADLLVSVGATIRDEILHLQGAL